MRGESYWKLVITYSERLINVVNVIGSNGDAKMDKNFWNKKRVLVTGHTGFKGSWLCLWLLSMGAEVIGYALAPQYEECNFCLTGLADRIVDVRGDIRNRELLNETFQKYQPEIVFHLAAQPLVLESYKNPYETYEINVMGTLNVLDTIRLVPSVRVAVMVTTDKCYENKETLIGYKEDSPFGGYDPYSSSKACDEILISSYRNSFFPLEKWKEHKIAIASVRAGNVIGGGDWAKDRILPDCIRAIEEQAPIKIRNRFSVRPWQHVLEPLSGYLKLAQYLYLEPIAYSGGWNFGPNEDSVWNVWQVAECIVKNYGEGNIEEKTQENAFHEAGKLVLNIDKAKEKLKWRPVLDVETAIKWTVDWYKNRKLRSVYDICMEEIKEYEKISELAEKTNFQ